MALSKATQMMYSDQPPEVAGEAEDLISYA